MPWNLPNLGIALALVAGALVLPAAASGELMGSVNGALNANMDDLDASAGAAGEATGSVDAAAGDLTAKVDGVRGDVESQVDDLTGGASAAAQDATGGLTGNARGEATVSGSVEDATGSARTAAEVTENQVNANNHMVLAHEDSRAANRAGVHLEPDPENPQVGASEQMNLGTEHADAGVGTSVDLAP